MADIVTIETPGLGDRSYIAHDRQVAVVIDPQRDIDRALDVVDRLGVRVTHVVETHLHNDYVTGGLALAQRTGAEYVVAAADPVSFERTSIAEGQRLTTGRLGITARPTPGHTPHHMAYVLDEEGDAVAVFTGGSMLFGAVGRTDLISEERTEELTRAQYRSVRRLAGELAAHVEVHPTHGFGSFCSATKTTTDDSSTIGQERERNVALVTDDEDRFVNELLGGLGAYPRYYEHMAAINASGPAAPDLSPPEMVNAELLRGRIDGGEWVVDLRERQAFARTHVVGTVSIELGDPFATYFGWTLPWQAPVTLVGDSADQIVEARRQLVRIGIDHLAGAAIDDINALAAGRSSGYRVATFAELGEAFDREGKVILDVRRPDEWAQSHLVGAVHVPFWELADRVGELPDAEIWVHCASGFRASIGASIVDRAGGSVVLIDDDWEQAKALHLPTETAR